MIWQEGLGQKKGHQPIYIFARFFSSVACTMSSSTWPSTESGTDSPGRRPRSLFRTDSRTPEGVSGTFRCARRLRHVSIHPCYVRLTMNTYLFPYEVRGWIVKERLQNGHQSILILSKKIQAYLASSPKWSFRKQAC